MMMLPYRPKLGLYGLRILKLPYLLELVNAYDDVAAFAPGYLFNHIQHFL